MHSKGFAAFETKTSLEKARLLIEQAETLGEPSEDPLLLYSVLYGFWIAHFAAFDGNALRELAAQFLELAEKSGSTVATMNGRRLMGASLVLTGEFAEGLTHLNVAIALHSPKEHGPLATRFGLDAGVVALHWHALASWSLGYPAAAQADIDRALSTAREIGHAPTLAHALNITGWTQAYCGNFVAAKTQVDEAIELAEEKGASYIKTIAMMTQGWLFALAGDASRAVQAIPSSMAAYRSGGATLETPLVLSGLAKAHAKLGQFDDALRCIEEALTAAETSGERWSEADIHRLAGEIALASPERNWNKAQDHFQRALAIARDQKARSWELRAAMSLARLWRDQSKRAEALELLTPVYSWFTEGFDTLDLREAKTLLDELAS
jgi:predicted ATPase